MSPQPAETPCLTTSPGWQSELGLLSDPKQYTGEINMTGQNPAIMVRALESMLRIRLTEETLAAMVEAQEVHCPVHLAIGQEAMAVGVAAYLRPGDRAFGSHRSHGHYLAMGGDAHKLLAEAAGKYTGCSHGLGGSMHLYAAEHGFYGSVPIVAGTIPLAVGAGLAAKMTGKSDIGVAFFGDGACEEGAFHEALNMASSLQIPVAFIVENNLFSSHLDIQLRQPSDRMARFAEAARIPHETIDGNDIVAVMKSAERLIGLARDKGTPVLLEGITYRWLGHVGPKEDVDVGVRRSMQDITAWKKRDPIRRLRDALISRGHYSAARFDACVKEEKARLAQLRQTVAADPWPDETMLLDIVYAR